MYSINIRLLPINSKIVINKDEEGILSYSVFGKSDITETEFLKELINNNIDILVKDNSVYEKNYLINKAIEMLIFKNNDFVTNISLRICLCFLNEGLKESYNFAQTVNNIIPIKCWVDNEYGFEIDNKEKFINENMNFIQNKYDIFKKSFGSINFRLTESEFYKYQKKIQKGKQSFKRNLKGYTSIKI